MVKNFWAVIMAGGSGTRFWPESRAAKPKQFLNIFGKHTLLEQTGLRIQPLIPNSRWLAVTQSEQVSQVSRLLKIPASQVIGEPVGRNTAPCAVLAARLIVEKDPDAVLAILPSDHRIAEEELFRNDLAIAAEAAAKTGLPVTLGIQPSSPHTGYGYLELGDRAGKIYRLKRFHEKPSLINARKYLKSGRFLWNSGMFVWKASSLLAAAKKHLPEALEIAEKIAAGTGPKKKNGPVPVQMQKFYSQMPNISIDYGLMEKMPGQILAVPAQADWQDLGSWQAYSDLWPKDSERNMLQGNVLAVESSGNIVKSGGRLIAMIGVQDHVIVDTDDVLLVCPKDKTESVKKIVEELRKKKLAKYL